jgi:hypothetical protein
MNDPSLIITLWQSGAFLAAGILAIYLGLTLALKVDSKRAFYYAAATGGLASLVDLIVAGHKLTWSAVVVALTTIASVIAKGPELKKTAEPGA